MSKKKEINVRMEGYMMEKEIWSNFLVYILVKK